LQKEDAGEKQANRYSRQHIFISLVDEIQGKSRDNTHQDQVDEKYDKIEQYPAIPGFKNLLEISVRN
jgi:hypothetical protein